MDTGGCLAFGCRQAIAFWPSVSLAWGACLKRACHADFLENTVFDFVQGCLLQVNGREILVHVTKCLFQNGSAFFIPTTSDKVMFQNENDHGVFVVG